MTMNTEQDEAIAALKLADGQALLDRIATRENIEASTASANAVTALLNERAKLRTTLRRCVVFACVLIGAWTVYGWIILH